MSSEYTSTTAEESSSARSNARRTLAPLVTHARDGSLAVLAGAASLGWAVREARQSKGRTALLGLASVALLGWGVRRLRAERRAQDIETGADARRDGGGQKRVSDEAHAEAERDLGAQRTADESASVYQSESEPNPRGMSDRSDVETEDGGDPQFVEGERGGPHRETHLEDESAHDPRLHPESDDEPTEVDLSEAAMADEASEAAGPHPEQAYPAREGTDPEPTSEKAPERIGEGAVAPGGADDESNAESTADEGERGSDDARDADDEPR